MSAIYGMNRRMDAGVGRILEALDRHGLREGTLVPFSSDNGPQFGGQGEASTVRHNGDLQGSKGTVFEGGIRVPAILRWPDGLPGAGGRVAHLVHFTDWLPTLLAVAGVDPAGGPVAGALDGRDALPLLRARSEAMSPALLAVEPLHPVGRAPPCGRGSGSWYVPASRRRCGWRRRTWPVTGPSKRCPAPSRRSLQGPSGAHPLPPAPSLLYHLGDDPYERHDLAPRGRSGCGRLESLLEGWFAEVEQERAASATERTLLRNA